MHRDRVLLMHLCQCAPIILLASLLLVGLPKLL